VEGNGREGKEGRKGGDVRERRLEGRYRNAHTHTPPPIFFLSWRLCLDHGPATLERVHNRLLYVVRW